MAVGGKVAAGFVGLMILGGITHACDPDHPTSTGAASTTTTPTTTPTTASAVPVDSSTTASTSPVSLDLPNPASATPAHVTRVVDGETFQISTGQTVRVLGIDSCAANTYGGRQATATARMLTDQDVYLTTQSGVTTDRSGRLLRYVATSSGADFGKMMVGYDHTGVQPGGTTASPAYLGALRAADPNGRSCSAPAASTTRSTGGDGGYVYVPHHDHGLPDGALTGGYCARKWWC